jgi:type IV secretion system protein VirB3
MENGEEQRIVVDPLFVGLTRPATMWGVPYTGVVIEVLLVAIVFLAMGNPLYLLLALPIHGILYAIGSHDPGIFDSIAMSAKTVWKCRNAGFWNGAASFAPGVIKKWPKKVEDEK